MPSKKRRIEHAEIVKLFAARLRERRNRAGLTQTELARKASLTLSYVGRLEAAGAAPGIDTVSRLASALDTTIHDLLPVQLPPETLAAVKDRARTQLEHILQKADRELVQAVMLVLSQISDGLIRSR